MGVLKAAASFNVDLHARPADVADARVDAQDVADLDRTDEGHAVKGDGDDAPLRALDAADAAGLVHLAEHPPAENVAVGVGVARHRHQAHREVAARLVVGVGRGHGGACRGKGDDAHRRAWDAGTQAGFARKCF